MAGIMLPEDHVENKLNVLTCMLPDLGKFIIIIIIIIIITVI